MRQRNATGIQDLPLLWSKVRVELTPVPLRWEPLLAHSHWFSIRARGKELRLCARCSGVVLGFLSLKGLWTALFTPSLKGVIPFHIGFPVALLLALPAISDWVTQTVGFRESTNSIRLFTGFLEGVGILCLSVTDSSSLVNLLLVSAISGSVIIGGVLLRRRQGSTKNPALNVVN